MVSKAKKQYDGAIADYDAAIRLNPKDANYFAARGAAYYAKDRYEAAIADYHDAIRLDPNDAYFFAARGAAYYAINQFDRAIEDYDEAIRLDPPKSADAFYIRIRGDAHNAKGQYDRAIEDYDEAVRLDPKDAFSLASRGRVYIVKGQYDRAIADYDKAIQLDPSFTLAINNRAEAIARKSELGSGTIDLLTTAGLWGLATRFSRAGFVYVVSTVHRKEFGGYYQTTILKHSSTEWEAGDLAKRQTVYRIEAMSQVQSVEEHIDTVRMALSKDEDAW